MEKKVINIIKILSVIVIIIGILISFSNISYATGGMSDVTDILKNDKWSPKVEDSATFNSKVKTIISIIRYIGIIVSVVSLMIMGIKYMFSSVEEKANYKQSMYPWLIGAIMVFAITTIPGFIYELITNMKI